MLACQCNAKKREKSWKNVIILWNVCQVVEVMLTLFRVLGASEEKVRDGERLHGRLAEDVPPGDGRGLLQSARSADCIRVVYNTPKHIWSLWIVLFAVSRTSGRCRKSILFRISINDTTKRANLTPRIYLSPFPMYPTFKCPLRLFHREKAVALKRYS